MSINVLNSRVRELLQNQPQGYATTALAALGAAWASYKLYSALSNVYFYTLRPGNFYRYKKTSDGKAPWALITGASDGIGKGFAAELCSQGFNIILHGRNQQKLNGIKDWLQKQWPKSEFRFLILDAGTDVEDAAKMEAAVGQLKGLNLKVLVNNVGGTSGMRPGWLGFTERDYEKTKVFLNVNSTFTMELTRLLLPQLSANQPALILNMSSAAAVLCTPYLTLYSGTKAFLIGWGRSLYGEQLAEGNDVEVKTIVVGFVATETENREPTFWTPSTRRFAKSCLDVVGSQYTELYSYFPHAIYFGLIMMLPTAMSRNSAIDICKTEKEREAREVAKTN